MGTMTFIYKMYAIRHSLIAMNFGFGTCTCNGKSMITQVNCKIC